MSGRKFGVFIGNKMALPRPNSASLSRGEKKFPSLPSLVCEGSEEGGMEREEKEVTKALWGAAGFV